MKSINKHMKSIRANSKLYRFWGNNAIDVGYEGVYNAIVVENRSEYFEGSKSPQYRSVE